jgi:hypothetical protein
MALTAIITVVVALLYANFLEWALHKWVLHKWGKERGSYWSEHYRVHHRNYNRFGGRDPDYINFKLNSEVLGLLGLAVLHSPVALLSPLAYGTLFAHGVTYYLVHRYSHVNPEWGWKWIPWHMEHHRGREANWCVLFPFWDHVLRTRVKVGRR